MNSNGNVTNPTLPPPPSPPPPVSAKQDKISAARCLPTVATYNLRSLLPKIGCLTTDVLERKIDCRFLTEIWGHEDNSTHQFEIEKLLELHGLKYISTSRKPNRKGVCYGGAAILVNLEKFSCEKLPVAIPQNIEAVWGMLRPKNPGAKFKKIIVCLFYSPPNKQRNSKMADHIVGTLHMLAAKHPSSAIILGADNNYRQGVILDIIVMNTFPFYNSPFIVPPVQPDDPAKAKPSDHSVPVCVPPHRQV